MAGPLEIRKLLVMTSVNEGGGIAAKSLGSEVLPLLDRGGRNGGGGEGLGGHDEARSSWLD